MVAVVRGRRASHRLKLAYWKGAGVKCGQGSFCELSMSALGAKSRSPDQQPDHASNQTDGCKGGDNSQIDQCNTGLFDEVARRIRSRGKTGAADFELGHGANFLSITPSRGSQLKGTGSRGTPRSQVGDNWGCLG